MIRAPLPSVESHLMEGVVTLRPIRSHERLTAPPQPPPSPSPLPACLYSSICLSITLTPPLLGAPFRSNPSCKAPLIFNQFQQRRLSLVSCLSVSLQKPKSPTREDAESIRGAEWGALAIYMHARVPARSHCLPRAFKSPFQFGVYPPRLCPVLST